MSAWVLIIFAYAGAMSNSDSNSLTVSYFTTEQHCKFAGEQVSKMSRGTTKNISFVCARTGMEIK